MVLRNELSSENKWDLNHIFKDDNEFLNKLQQFEKEFLTISKFKGTLHENLIQCLKCLEDITIRFLHCYSYGTMKYHTDMGNTKYKEFYQKVEMAYGKLLKEKSFIEPEIIKISNIENIIKTKEFEPYKQYIENILRNKDYILSDKEESLLALTSELSSVPEDIFTTLQNVDMDFGTVLNENGEEVKLTNSSYSLLLYSKNRKIRETVFKSYYKQLIKFKNTYTSIYTGSLKKDIFHYKARGFNSSMEMFLFDNNIPTTVYTNLINTVSKYLDVLQKYITLKKEVLQIDEFHMYDMYVPLINDVETKIPYEKGCELVKEGLEILGEQYSSLVNTCLNNNWIDVYETKDKISGAYSWGVYGVHPFILHNYNDNINSVYTLAHEIGHAMHSYYSDNNNNYFNSNYSIFLAEIASTVNESLLTNYLLKEETDVKKMLFVLNAELESFRGTIFRQTLFAEFEMIAHQMIEKGDSISFDTLNEVYKNLNIKYYGQIKDEEIQYEWMRLPHYYSPFYVYQYATGKSAATAIANKIINEKGYKEKYVTFLKAGCSKYPLDILKDIDIDMTKQQPIEEALDVFTKLVNKFEKLIKESKK